MKITRYHRYCGLVLLVFLAATLFFTGLFNIGGGRVPYFSQAPKPESPDWYIDLQYGTTESHYHVLYNDFGPSIDNARKADVLILGDSQSLLGFDWRGIEAFSEEHNLSIFNMAIDGGTGWEFPLAIMRRYGLCPKAVIIGRTDFFTNPVFQAAKAAMDSSRLESFKRILSGETMWRLKNALQMVSPALLHLLYPKNSFHGTYRSTVNGCWFRDGWFDDSHRPLLPREGECTKDIAIPPPFVEYLQSCGTAVLVGPVAEDNYCPQQIRRLAEALHGESVIVSPDGLATYDGNHLDKASSEAFTDRFLQAFRRTKAFAALTGTPPQPQAPQ